MSTMTVSLPSKVCPRNLSPSSFDDHQEASTSSVSSCSSTTRLTDSLTINEQMKLSLAARFVRFRYRAIRRSLLSTMAIVLFAIYLITISFVEQVEASEKVTQPGDILLGGIFPIHQKSKGKNYEHIHECISCIEF